MEKAWDIKFSHETGNYLLGGPQEIISCLLSHEKISCLMRFSHGIYKEGMRHEIFSWDRRFSSGEVPPKRNLLSPVSWENLSFHKIFSWDLWRRHETLDFLMRQEIFSWGPPRRKSPVSCFMRKFHMSQDFLMGFMEKAWDIRFSHETGDYLVSHEIISCLLRFSFGIYGEGMRH